MRRWYDLSEELETGSEGELRGGRRGGFRFRATRRRVRPWRLGALRARWPRRRWPWLLRYGRPLGYVLEPAYAPPFEQDDDSSPAFDSPIEYMVEGGKGKGRARRRSRSRSPTPGGSSSGSGHHALDSQLINQIVMKARENSIHFSGHGRPAHGKKALARSEAQNKRNQQKSLDKAIARTLVQSQNTKAKEAKKINKSKKS